MTLRPAHLAPRALTATCAAVLVVVLAACGSSSEPAGPARADGPTGDGLTAELTVLAAASLEPVLDELASAFVGEHPGARFAPVTYDGSSTLATQLVEGARADVLVTADTTSLQTVLDAGLVDGEPVVVATNTLQVVVPAGNPDGVGSLADLAALSADGGKVVLCAEQVPCGAAAASVLAAARATLTPASLEQNVTAVLTKVAAGEADAGLVYRTDVRKAGSSVEGVDVPESADAVNSYPAAVLADATAPDAARAFVAFLASDEARSLLAAHGFGPASAGS